MPNDPQPNSDIEQEDAKKKNTSSAQAKGSQTLADELGIVDLSEPVFGGRGRLFSAAGRDTPVAEFTQDFLVLHPPQKPFDEGGEVEVITSHNDQRGVLLDELGREKRIPGAKYKGNQIYWMAAHKEGTLKHIPGWFDEANKVHRLYSNNQVLTVDDVFKLRNRTHDGELSIYPDLHSD